MRRVCIVAYILVFLLGGVSLWGNTTPRAICKATADSTEVIPLIVLPEVDVFATGRARKLTSEERKALWRRIRDVKKTLPYAKYVAATLIETYEYMETLPNDKERERHLKQVQRDLREEMEPQMRKLTLGQGKILIKLVYRQCGVSGYELVKAVLGGWKAWWWNSFARILGANLKEEYDPANNPDDATTERIIRLVEDGRL